MEQLSWRQGTSAPPNCCRTAHRLGATSIGPWFLHDDGCAFQGPHAKFSADPDWEPVNDPDPVTESRWSSRLCMNGQRDWLWTITSYLRASYKYVPLPSQDSIRILQLHPAGFSDRDDQLSGSLHIVRLGQASYEALSYVWGDQREIVSMKIDGHNFPIGKNLEAALRQIRSSRRRFLNIWVDAICLNQADNSEKSHQVRNFRQIYSLAERDIVWLSPSSEGGLAFEDAKNIVQDIHFRTSYFEQWKTTNTTQRLQELTCQKWFHRTWTCQEIGLAKRATFYIGTYTIEWETLYDAFRIIEEAIGLPDLKKCPLHTDRVTFLYQSFKHKSFRELLAHTCARGSKLPQDKIFAILSHPSALNQSTGRPFMDPDYSKSTSHVFAETTCEIIRSEGGFKVWEHLSLPRQNELYKEWPSWSPIWTDATGPAGLVSKIDHFNACGNYDDVQGIHMTLDRDMPILLVYGFTFDVVEEPTMLDTTYTMIADRAERVCDAGASQARRKFVRDKIDPAFGDDFEKHPFYYRFRCRNPESISPVKRNSLEWLRSEGYYYVLKSTVGRGMTPFVARQVLIGAVHQVPQLGDVVAIICGCRVPYLLRPASVPNIDQRGNRYRLMGECYVQSMMQGQIEEQVAAGLVHVSSIELC